MTDAEYHFLSFVRTGFAAAIMAPDTLGAAQPALASVAVGVSVAGGPTPVSHRATVRGPGDVVGLTASQVVRTDPVDGAVGVEPNYFAQIEFDRPDLPWLFTPAAAAGERLRPWIVLVVVDLTGLNACTLSNGTPLPTLTVPAAAAEELPDLASSSLWAHAQAVTPSGQTVDAALDGDPRLAVSRLLCPRHLSPDTDYLAAVVPAFEVGRLAGLGAPVTAADETQLAPAWTPGVQTVLPVYYSFRFRTGTDADFESLARKLTGRPLPTGVGSRPMDVSRPGAGLPPLPAPAAITDTASITWMDGALHPVEDSADRPPRDPAAAEQFRTALTVLLDRPATLLRGGDADPVIAPPIYGGQHVLVVELGAGVPPPWITELNLDPVTRVAAGLGTQVVQARQEDLMNRAWRQLGDVLAANQLLRKAQLARTAALRVHERLGSVDAPTLLAATAPVHARVTGVTGAPVTLTRLVRDSRLPDATATPAFRRLARPLAVTARTAGAPDLSASVVARYATEVLPAPNDNPDGLGTMRAPSEVIGPSAASATLVALGELSGGSAPLDVAVATLAANAAPLPSGDELRSGSQTNTIGAVALVTSLGAVPAAAVAAALHAAATASPPPQPVPSPVPPVHPLPPMPPVHPLPPPVHPLSPHSAPPTHPLAPVAGPPVVGPIHPGPVPGPIHPGPVGPPVRPPVVFNPPGRIVDIDPGKVVLRGGTVVVTDDTIARIVSGGTAVSTVDDSRWTQIVNAQTVPPIVASADPASDPGTRLDAIRRDPAALTALAQVAEGQLRGTLALDRVTAGAITGTAAATSLSALASGAFTVALPRPAATVTGPDDLTGAKAMVAATAAALDLVAVAADAPPPPAGPALDLASARTDLLAKVDPAATVSARVHARLTSRAIVAVPARDDLDPVMACPTFADPMWEAVRDLGKGWLLPGLELVPPDTATLVATNPSFVAAHMVGLNHEFMRELLWREYPTDQRGTAFARFWGRSGAQPDDIGPVHLFTGDLVDNLLTGKDAEAVLLLRSELLRRYPGSIVYLCRATQQGDQLVLDDGTNVLPTFRGDLPPDVTFVGFPIAPDDLRTAGDPWWFVIAQPPSEPRFGLDDPADDTPAIPTTASDLAWSHMSPDGNPETPAPFALADPPALRGHLIDGSLTWGANAAVTAHLTYQHPVRVAIRAADLLPPEVPR